MTHAQHFHELGINKQILEALTRNKFVTPTPIQAATIPTAITGKDIIGIAQTGTGKTLAFGIPMIQRIGSTGCHGLVVVPTRELAQQVDEALQRIGRVLGVRTAVLIGGESMPKQLSQLRARPHIIVATPGRLNDHLQQRTVQLLDTHILVLDEADRMLDMGFAPQIKKIIQMLPTDRQTMLFSATMPQQIVKLSAQYMKLPVRVEVAPAGTAAENVTHELFFVKKEQKLRLLEMVLKENNGTVLVFSRTKFGAKKICAALRKAGHRASEIHSNRSLNQRRESLEGFKRGKYRILVATDIAARGIDVHNIALVINYDLPENAEDYVHRIGRTGRAGLTGKALSFATPEQRRDVRDIERLIRVTIPTRQAPDLPNIPYPAADVTPRYTQARSAQPQYPQRSPHRAERPPQRSEHAPRGQEQTRFGDRRRGRPAPFHSDNRVFFGPGAYNAPDGKNPHRKGRPQRRPGRFSGR